MLIALIQLLVRLAITCITLALRLALAIASLVGTLLGHLIMGLWRSWRSRKATSVPLRAPKQIDPGSVDLPALPPPSQTTYVPRPMRPRPRR